MHMRRRVQILVTSSIVSANVVGALVVIGLNVWVIPGDGLLDTSRRGWALVLSPAYLAVAVVVGAWLGTRQQLGELRWAVEDRAPSPAEQRAALRAPAQLLIVQIVLWALAVAVFGGLAAAGGPGWVVVRTVTTVAMGGTVTCGYAYLLSEGSFRPVAARALAESAVGTDATPGLGTRTLLVWVVGTGVPIAGLMIVGARALVDERVSAAELGRTVLVLGGITVVAGSVLLVLATRAITDPLRDLSGALGQVEDGELSTRIVVYDGTEIGRVQAAFNQMVRGLEERERLHDLFSRHVGDDVARAALDRGTRLGGEQCEASAVFVDIVGSTALAEQQSPEAVVAVLNRFFERIVTTVDAHGGWVNKFEGDAALCVFGPPTGLADHADAGAARRPGAATPARPTRGGGRDPGRRGRRLGAGDRRQRRRSRPLRVHGDRRPGERGRPADRAGQGTSCRCPGRRVGRRARRCRGTGALARDRPRRRARPVGTDGSVPADGELTGAHRARMPRPPVRSRSGGRVLRGPSRRRVARRVGAADGCGEMLAVGGGEPGPPVDQLDREGAGVDSPVVPAAQEHEVVDGGRAPVFPPDDVVGIAPPDGAVAARYGAVVAVSCHQGTAHGPVGDADAGARSRARCRSRPGRRPGPSSSRRSRVRRARPAGDRTTPPPWPASTRWGRRCRSACRGWCAR